MKVGGFIGGVVAAIALVIAAPGAALAGEVQAWPVTRAVEVVVHPVRSNRLPACRITGKVTLWTSRPVTIVDDSQARVGTMERR